MCGDNDSVKTILAAAFPMEASYPKQSAKKLPNATKVYHRVKGKDFRATNDYSSYQIRYRDDNGNAYTIRADYRDMYKGDDTLYIARQTQLFVIPLRNIIFIKIVTFLRLR